VPRFRGDVNSIGIVCRPAAAQGAKWDVSLFRRSRIEDFEPIFAGESLDLAELRRIVLTLVICSYYAILSSPPYSTILSKAMDAEFRVIWPPKDKERRGSTIRRSLTAISFRQSDRSSKEAQSSSGSTSPREKLRASSSPPSPESDLEPVPFPGISLRRSANTPMLE
jgi:hypothetical protein